MSDRVEERAGRLPRGLLILAIAFTPILVMLLLGASFGDAIQVKTRPNDSAPQLFGSVSSDLSQLAIIIIGASAFLFRETSSRTPKFFWAVGIGTFSAAAASYYAGFRYRTGLAEQISANMFSPMVISDRLQAQGVLLLVAFLGLSMLALLVYYPLASSSLQGGADENAE